MVMCDLKHDLTRVNIRILLLTGEKGRDYNLVFKLSVFLTFSLGEFGFEFH